MILIDELLRVNLLGVVLDENVKIPKEKDAVTSFKNDRHSVECTTNQILHDDVVSCSAFVFTKYLRIFDYLLTVDHY